jgi:spermidine/putrescine transport system substrate-binding protein
MSELDRRAFIQRAMAMGLTFSSASALLQACGGIEGENKNSDSSSSGSKSSAAVSHPKTQIAALAISNWPLYIDKKTVKNFDAKYGGKTKYTEDVNDNEEFFGKVRQQLSQGRDIGRDIMVLTDWMAARNVRLGYLEPLDKNNIPNIKNLQPTLQHPNWDPDRKYSLPWQTYMTAIGYNKKKVPEINSIDQMFDPKYKGRVSMLSDARDAANMIMLKNGVKPEDAKIDDVLKAIEEIDKINRTGQIRRFTGNDYTTDLTKGNLWICQAYSGDVVQLQADNPDLDFVIPEQGGSLGVDNMLMPKHAQHYYAAETFMNYVYDPEVQAKITAYVNYVPPVVGTKEVLEKKDPKLASNQLIFPDDATLAKLHGYPNLNEDEERQMNEAMQAVVGA